MDPMARVNSFLDKSRKTNLSVNQMYDEAEKLLVDKVITPDEFKSIVEKAALEKDKYGRPTFARPVSQSEISKTLEPALESTKNIVKTKQEKLLEEFADLKAKEAVTLESQKSLGQLPKKTAEQIARVTKEQILQNPQEFDFKGISAQEVTPIFLEERGKLISAKDTPLTEIFPSLKGTSIDPGEAEVFRKILRMPETADITGDKLQEYMRTARSSAFLEGGTLSDKPSAAFATEARKKISELSPEAGKLMEAENIELSKLEGLENAGYINRTGEGLKTKIEMTDTQRNKLVKDLATSYKGSTPTDVTENLQVLKDYLSPDQFKKLELSAIKLAEQNAGDIDYFPSSILNKIFSSLKVRKVSRGLATLPQSMALNFPKTAAVGKFLGKSALKTLPFGGAAIGAIAAQAAEEALESETSGAMPETIETPERRNAPIPKDTNELETIQSPYWFERGIRDPEEQLQRARLASFKQELPSIPSEVPSPYEKPEIRERKEKVLAAKKANALAPTYVEAPKTKVLKADNPAEIASIAQSLSAGTDKASQEYARVLNQIVNAPAREKESILFGLNQQPAFRELVRKAKGEPNIEE
jgi:hypothetical protein